MSAQSPRPLASARAVVHDGLLVGVRRAYLIGIGGVGMSGAAEILRARGHEVLGSDRNPPPGADRDDARLPARLDLVVHSAAISPDHPQIREARSRGIPFHTDAAQSAGKMPVDVGALGADLLTIAGHKLYGPKGVGALYVRRGLELAPLMLGAGHEGPGALDGARACQPLHRRGIRRGRGGDRSDAT